MNAAKSVTATFTLFESSTVRGSITYYSNSFAVPGVTVQLSGAAQLSTQTDASGNFQFANVPNGDYSISYHKNTGTGDSGSITALDASHALQGSTGLFAISGTQLKACDVNNTGRLTALDASDILQYRVGLISYFLASNGGTDNWGFDTPVDSFFLAAGGTQNQQVSAYFLGDCKGSWPNQ